MVTNCNLLSKIKSAINIPCYTVILGFCLNNFYSMVPNVLLRSKKIMYVDKTGDLHVKTSYQYLPVRRLLRVIGYLSLILRDDD